MSDVEVDLRRQELYYITSYALQMFEKRHSRHKVSTLILNLVVLQAHFKGSSTHLKTSSPVLASN